MRGLVPLLLGSCDEPSRLSFSVPGGFRGVFVLIEDDDAPDPTVRADGTHVISVPASGRVRMNDTTFLEHISSMTAAYADGTPLPISMLEPSAPFTDAVALYLVSVDADGTYSFFVGTDRQMASIHESGFEPGG